MSITYTANDPEYFEVYCPKHYDRHNYKLVFKNGKSETFTDYKVMKFEWYTLRDRVSHVEVVDKSGKGF